MTLHKKVLVIISVAVVALMLILYAASHLIVLGSFVELEEHYTIENVRRAESALWDEIEALDTFVLDWARWDDTYNFVENANEEYLQSNLVDESLIGVRLNLIMFVHSSGRIVAGKAFDLEHEKEIPISPYFLEHLQDHARLLQHTHVESGIAGILLLPEAPMLVAARPILTSAKQGPIRGTLIMGRSLTSKEIERLSDVTHLALKLARFDDSETPHTVQQTRSSLSEEFPTFTQALNNESIAGYTLINDIYGNPALVLTIEMPREIYRQGKASLLYFVVSLFIVGIAIEGIIWLLLENVVLSRLDRLNTRVNQININKDLSIRVELPGQDELSHLADSINRMLMVLEKSQQELQDGEARFRGLAEASFEGIVINAKNNRILDANHAMVKMFGYHASELIGKNVLDLITPEYQEMVTKRIQVEYEKLYEAQGIRKDGTIFPIEIQAKAIPYQSTMVMGAAIRDITWRKLAEEASRQRTREMTLLNHMNALFQTCHTEQDTYEVIMTVCKLIFSSDSGCICILDETHTKSAIVASWGNPPLTTKEFAADACQVLQRKETVMLDHAAIQAACPHLEYAPETNSLCVPITNQGEVMGILSLCLRPREPSLSDEEYNRMLESKQMLATRIAMHYALSLSNLRLRETLRRESISDPLTGLYNRRYMEESLEREARRAERRNTPIGLIMLDVDHFKRLNDTYGHAAGDLALQQLSALLKDNIRREDIACRYGGEEFLLIMPEAPLEVVIQRAEELRSTIEALQIEYQEQRITMTSSLGIAAIPHHGRDVKQVIKTADAALYQAKTGGRNQVVVASSSELGQK